MKGEIGLHPDYSEEDRDQFEECKKVSSEQISHEEQERQVRFPRFKIHGLWPSNSKSQSDTDKPKNCRGAKYDRLTVGAVEKWSREDIDYYWPSIIWKHKTRGNHLFWEYEWNKHGRCAAIHPAIKNLAGYFEKTLNLTRVLDPIQRRLQDILSHLPPDVIGQFWIENFEKLFQGEGGFEKKVRVNYKVFEIRAGIYDDKKVKRLWIESVSFCFNINFEPKDCYQGYIPKQQLDLPNTSDIDDLFESEEVS